MNNKTFTFKYDPSISLGGTFVRMNEVVRTGKPHIQKDCSIVNSIEAIYRSMTKSRLELFQCLVDKQPTSLYQLAQLLKRDYAGVWRDAKVLAGTGIIELKEEGEKLKPIALYDRIVFDFPVKEVVDLANKQSVEPILSLTK